MGSYPKLVGAEKLFAAVALRPLRLNSGQAVQQDEHDGLAFRSEGLEVVAVIVDHEGVAHGLEGRGIRQGIHQGQRLGGLGESRQAEQAVHREVKDLIGFGMGEAPRQKREQRGPPIVGVIAADLEEHVPGETILQL